MCKLMESIIIDNINTYLEENSLISNINNNNIIKPFIQETCWYYSGLRHHSSCLTNLLPFYKRFQYTIEKEKIQFLTCRVGLRVDQCFFECSCRSATRASLLTWTATYFPSLQFLAYSNWRVWHYYGKQFSVAIPLIIDWIKISGKNLIKNTTEKKIQSNKISCQ